MSEPTFQILDNPEPAKAEAMVPARVKPVNRRKLAEVSGTAPARTRKAPVTPPIIDVPDIDDAPTPLREVAAKPEKTATAEPKSGPPSLNEWQDFFGRIVVKLLVDFYLFVVLGDIIDDLSQAELKAILLSEEDLKEVAAPLAELANKSSFMRKHGRLLVASADSFESVMTLVLWMRRVNRIAKKHRPAQPNKRQRRAQQQQQRYDQQMQEQMKQPGPTTQNGYQHEDANGFGSREDGSPFGAQFGVFNPGAGG